MNNSDNKETVKRKVLFFFITVVIGLVLLFSYNQKGIHRISTVIDELTEPNPKQIALTNFQHRIADLTNLQRLEEIQDQKEPSEIFLQEAKNIKQSSDTLKILFKQEPQQLKRINRIDSLLKIRNSLFIDYLEIKYNYVRGGVLERQLNELSKNIDEQNVLIDSNVVTTTKSYKTTTIIPTISEEMDKKKKRKIRKNQLVDEVVQPQIIVEEKLSVKIDTVAVAQRDSILAGIEKSLQRIEKKQKKSREFVKDQEMVLFETNGLIIGELMKAVRGVENEEFALLERKNSISKALAKDTLKITEIILFLIGCVALGFAGLIIRDVVRINRYRRELEAAKNEAEYHSVAKQRFLANMSHEIRTPLQSIIGYSDLLKNNQHSKENVNAIAYASNHLMQVVNEILDYSRIISGKFSFESTVFHLQSILNEAWSSLVLHPKASSLQMNLELPEDQIYLKGDSFRLKQIVFNLVGNAIKFTSEGFVLLKVDAIETANSYGIKFYVIDSGQGISEKDIAVIFNQFEQSENTTSQQGTGLGLSIVKELVEAQGGTISVTSVVGKGTTFEFFIRYVKASNKVLKESEPIDFNKDILFDGEIWLVDDDQLILRLYASILDRNRIGHRLFNSAKDLLETPVDSTVKMIFADVRMPEISGLVMTRSMREKGIDLPIIAVTAQVLPDEQEQLLEQGFTAILTKPFTEDVLLSTLQNYFRNEIRALNFSSVKNMFEDEVDFLSILEQFKSDCEKDISDLKDGVKRKDIETVKLLVHRFGGRIAQMGDIIESEKWKKLELLMNSDKLFLDNLDLMMTLSKQILELEQQLLKLKNT